MESKIINSGRVIARTTHHKNNKLQNTPRRKMHYTTDTCGPTTQKLVDGGKSLYANQRLLNPEASHLNLLTLQSNPDSTCRRMLQRNPTHHRSEPTSATAPAHTGLEHRPMASILWPLSSWPKGTPDHMPASMCGSSRSKAAGVILPYLMALSNSLPTARTNCTNGASSWSTTCCV